MGPVLVLVSPCFRENVNVTCKMVFFFFFFLYSLDNFLQNNEIVFFSFFFFLEIKFQNGAPLKKRSYF